MKRDLGSICGYYFRKLFIETPVGSMGRWLRRKTGHCGWYRNPKYWDGELAGSKASYLAGIDVDLRNAICRVLIGHFGPEVRSLLDIGCASGELAKILSSCNIEKYVGIDISDYAIEKARMNYDLLEGKRIPDISFHACDLCEFDPDNNSSFDAIVFNEVLYYLEPKEAILQVERYTKTLLPKGLLLISMKDDPKSHAIFRRLRRNFSWVHGILYQEQPNGVKHRVRISVDHPAFLVGVFRKYD